MPIQFLEEQQLPLPPTNEQQRIVDAVDSFLSRLDAAVANLTRVQAKLKAYRASVLKAAIEGRLVPTEAEIARQERRDYEPAQVLLDGILKERRRRWEEEELARLKKAGKTPKDGKWKAKYEEPAPPDTSKLPELPEGWCWTNLGQLKEFSLYGPRFSSDDYTDDGILVLRTSDISEGGRVNLATPPRLKLAPEEYEKYAALRGDLLITRTGSLGTLAVLDDDVRAIPGAYLIQYRLATPLTVVWYCFYFLKSPSAQADLIGNGKGVGRPNLNAPTIEGLPLPLPPIAEQGRIIDEIQRLVSVSDEVSVTAEGNAHRAVRLRQSVLKWAFEGKLVDQDPGDDPAEKILASIEAERAITLTIKKSRDRKAKAVS
ncbi:restriction endonuclease subunit S [Myxococcus sp. SDU36]|nr:restriction endonuclease subunit S [Myxococcus sp. SDU36]